MGDNTIGVKGAGGGGAVPEKPGGASLPKAANVTGGVLPSAKRGVVANISSPQNPSGRTAGLSRTQTQQMTQSVQKGPQRDVFAEVSKKIELKGGVANLDLKQFDKEMFSELLKIVKEKDSSEEKVALLQLVNQKGDLHQKREVVAVFSDASQVDIKINKQTLIHLEVLEEQQNEAMDRYSQIKPGDRSFSTSDTTSLKGIQGLNFKGDALTFISDDFDPSALSEGQFNALLASIELNAQKAVKTLEKGSSIPYQEKQEVSRAISLSRSLMKAVSLKGTAEQKKETVQAMASFSQKNREVLESFGQVKTKTVTTTFQETDIENGYLALRGSVLNLGKAVESKSTRFAPSTTPSTSEPARRATRGGLIGRMRTATQFVRKDSRQEPVESALKPAEEKVQEHFRSMAEDKIKEFQGLAPEKQKAFLQNNPGVVAWLKSTADPVLKDNGIEFDKELEPALQTANKNPDYIRHAELLKNLVDNLVPSMGKDEYYKGDWDDFLQYATGTLPDERRKDACDVLHVEIKIMLENFKSENSERYSEFRQIFIQQHPEHTPFLEKLMP